MAYAVLRQLLDIPARTEGATEPAHLAEAA
jgi:hypothetical protein